MTFRAEPEGRGRARLILGAAAALLLSAAPGASLHAGSNPDAQAALARGLAALRAQNPRVARVELMNAIKADPALAAARVAQARALLMMGNAIAARDELDMAARLGAAPSGYRHLLAQAALMTGQPEDALAAARANDIDPAEAEFAARIEGQALQALDRFAEAAAAFDRALAMAPDDAALWADIGRLNLAAGDMAAAHRASARAVELAPRAADALVLRAMLVREQYGLVAALPLFERAVQLHRDDVPALIEYAATLADAGRAGAALSLSRRALSLSPGLPRAYFLQAVMAARAGDTDLARALLRRTGGALDGRAATRLLRGVLHLQSGDATLAIRELEPLLAAQPLNLRARTLLARAYYLDGLYSDAERTLFPLVERADADAYALTLAARIHEALGDRARADHFLARASAPVRGAADVFAGAGNPGEVAAAAMAGPAQAYANLRYIRALLEAGSKAAALAQATRLRDANPGAPAAHMALGDCLEALGRPAEAARAYEASADIRFSEEVALRLVHAWSEAGERGRAERALNLYLAQNPMSIEALRLAGPLYLAAGDFDRALDVLETLRVRLGNQDAQLMADLARAWIGKGEADRALPFAAHAYRLQPASAVAADIFGWALHKARGRSDAAREFLEKAVQLAPDQALVHLHLGQYLAYAGQTKAARTELQLVVQGTDRQLAQEARTAIARL